MRREHVDITHLCIYHSEVSHRVQILAFVVPSNPFYLKAYSLNDHYHTGPAHCVNVLCAKCSLVLCPVSAEPVWIFCRQQGSVLFRLIHCVKYRPLSLYCSVFPSCFLLNFPSTLKISRSSVQRADFNDLSCVKGFDCVLVFLKD